MKKKYLLLLVTFIVIITSCSRESDIKIIPGEVWLDTESHPINAHSAGLMFDNGKYYWYGEKKEGETWKIEYIDAWECFRVDAGGINCYSSTNLIDWKFEGLALEPNTTDSLSEIHTSKVLERPKVIYNDKTKKYVMWLHVDSEDYSFARAGVAVSDKATGPYSYLGSFRPNEQMSRDMTLFKDDDGRAYHIYSSEDNATLYISLLSDDYLRPSGTYTRNFIDKSREAPAVFKHESKYYIITSGCTGWSPNAALLGSADSMLGTWEELYNPCVGPGKESTFNSQSTYVLPIEGKPGKFIFMADRWNKTNLKDSRYVWLPLEFENDSVVIKWHKSWALEN